MCTATLAPEAFNRTSRFAMRLPRFPNASAAAKSELATSARQHRQEQEAKTPRTSGSGRARATAPPKQQQSGMRRCQSANMARRRLSAELGAIPKSRSHSQQPTGRSDVRRQLPRQPAEPTTAPHPIPPSAGRARPSLAVDSHDLARMYDHATWNMYERIVTARRQRLSQIDSQDSSSELGTNTTASTTSSGGSASRRASQPDQSHGTVTATKATTDAKPIKTSSSHDESTLSTADATSDASSSSWSRTESRGTFPGAMAFGLASRAVGGATSCPPTMEHEDDDHFIFELDM